MSFKNRFFTLFFLFCGFVSLQCHAGSVRVDSFSWSAGDSVFTINESSSTMTSGGLYCPTFTLSSEICGLALVVYYDTNNFTNIIIYPGPYNVMTNVINDFINSLAGRTYSYPAGVTKNNIERVCVYDYIKTATQSGISIISGVCSGGGVAPTPEPASCTLSLDDQIMDFGNISASAFVTAGAGQAPSGVSELHNTLKVSCSTPESSLVNLAVTAGTVSGNMIVSSEPNVGFKISFGENSPTTAPITPNTSTSTYSVTLDSTGQGETVISGIPVSVTGSKPAAGVFTAVATIQAYWN